MLYFNPYNRLLNAYNLSHLILLKGGASTDSEDIIATGTFGRIYQFPGDPSKCIKKSLSAKNKKKLITESQNLQNVFVAITKLNLNKIKTIRAKLDSEQNILMQRIYPPTGQHKSIQIDYSVIQEEYDEKWKVFNPSRIIELKLLSEEDININIPYQLGCLWMAMIINFKIALWEPELVIGKLFNDVENSLFIIDFDKAMSVNDDFKTLKNGNPIYTTLTNIFPQPSSIYFKPFADGIRFIAQELNMSDIATFVIEGIQELYQSQMVMTGGVYGAISSLFNALWTSSVGSTAETEPEPVAGRRIIEYENITIPHIIGWQVAEYTHGGDDYPARSFWLLPNIGNKIKDINEVPLRFVPVYISSGANSPQSGLPFPFHGFASLLHNNNKSKIIIGSILKTNTLLNHYFQDFIQNYPYIKQVIIQNTTPESISDDEILQFVKEINPKKTVKSEDIQEIKSKMGSKDYFDIINQFKEEILKEHKNIKVHGESKLTENPRPLTVSPDFHLEEITKLVDSSVQKYYLPNLNILNEYLTINKSSIFGRVENAAIKHVKGHKIQLSNHFQLLRKMVSDPHESSIGQKRDLLEKIFVYSLYQKHLTDADIISIFRNLIGISELKRNQILTSTTLDHILVEAANNRL